MNFLTAVEKVSELMDTPNYFREDKCIQMLNKQRECAICVEHCPVNAISINKTLQIDHEKCVHCGLCLRLCPVGALVGEDSVSKLIRCFQFMETINCVELVCNQNPNPEFGPDGNSPVIQIDRCLAAYGPSVFLFFQVIGIHKVILRLDGCETCKISSAKKDLLQAKEDSERIISVLNSTQMNIEVIEKFDTSFQKRPVIQINNPPINRRSFLSLFSKQSINFLSKLLELSGETNKGGKSPSYERLRTIKLFKMMNKELPEGQQSIIAEILKINSISVNAHCSACGVCADICPTGALTFQVDDKENYQLKFFPLNCINCGICADCCEMGAIQVNEFQTSEQSDSAFDLENQVLLSSGELKRCKRCHVQYSSSYYSDLCPICEQRRANPFGFVLPQNIHSKN